MKIFKPQRRMIVTVSVVLLIALVGAVSLRIDFGEAENLESAATQKTSEDTARPLTATPSPVPSLVKIGLALAAVVACIYGGLWMLKKLMGRKYSGGGQDGNLELLESMYVAPKKTVSLVRVADRTVLIGVTEQGMNLLTEFDEAKSVQFIAQPDHETPSPQFAGLLKSASDRLKQIRVGKKSPALEH